MEATRHLRSLSYSLSEFAALVYGWLPRSLRTAAFPSLVPAFSLARRLPAVLAQFRPSVSLFEGKEKNSGRALSLVTCGREEALPYVLTLAFSEVKRREGLGRMRLRDMPLRLERLGERADMVVVHGDSGLVRPLGRCGFFLLPEWVEMTLDLGRPLEETWDLPGNKTLRENLRRIRKFGYTFEVTTNPNRFRDFYREMYLPFIPVKFGAATNLVGPRKMRLFFDNGVLLLVSRDGQPVAGNVITVSRGVAESLIIGLRHGDPVLRRQSALAASYYFTMLWAKGLGLRRVDFGGCRPFLQDGLVYYKKRWGMEIGGVGPSRNVYGLRPLRLTPAVGDFLAANPFLHLDGPRLRGLVLSQADRPLSPAALGALVRTVFVPGLHDLTVVAPAGFTAEARTGAAAGRWGRMLLHEEPLASYFRVGAET
jgi:hypothetical protein